MHTTVALRYARRAPLIQFLGKRTVPTGLDHSPRPHPEAPRASLPTSFAQYRERAQQHGPLSGYHAVTGGVAPREGEFFDRKELPQRFWRLQFSQEEMEVIESGGAAAFA
ncbi:hypothetical protein BJ508DRAFT_216756 [Ascobolus immersus RN42]|uniref:37S ribosomal protein YMR-31, mitochondrial n=1 Tax=Ascobolus immersus RN42 TaxID=1160509 RepID=A0A3N4HEZ7_ASCIM|nr:hypothetical protein BJ508DRAFT_216756 [Ascobolus immersus RN42]